MKVWLCFFEMVLFSLNLILSKSSGLSDGYATAFMLMTLEESKVFLQKHPELYVMLLYADEANKMQQFTTENFNSLIID